MPRTVLLRDWLNRLFPRQHSEQELAIEPASADASFRRYFRVTLGNGDTRIVMDALRGVNREGITVLVNLHDLATARDYCDRIVALNAGRLVFDGPPEDLTAQRIREVYGVSEEQFAEEAAAAPPRVSARRRRARHGRRGRRPPRCAAIDSRAARRSAWRSASASSPARAPMSAGATLMRPR